jgi:hypothetical protein
VSKLSSRAESLMPILMSMTNLSTTRLRQENCGLDIYCQKARVS